MGAPKTVVRSRRGLRALLVVALMCGALVVASPPAHAILACVDVLNGPLAIDDPTNLNDANYQTAFETPKSLNASVGLLANDQGPANTRLDLDLSSTDSDQGGTIAYPGDGGGFTYTPPEAFAGI